MDEETNRLTEAIIGACMEVHRELGPGLNESIYETAVCHELQLRGLRHGRQIEKDVFYKGRIVGKTRIDLVVEDKVIVELKACDGLSPVHRSQLITYLRITKLQVGLLINFNVKILLDGIKRVILTQ